MSKVKYYITKMKKNHVLERVGSSQKGQWNILVASNVFSLHTPNEPKS
ncbi:putative HTH transcriptional regulator [Catenibacillus scindens]|uniref:Putative HTH transcriptional regulator n=1 Tax=Catenibacillus scindens TaxID=673271 RepID=A0A7W8M585_9FIRM|nr:hypothetical protein [Catenibacillus scindens]MBB5264669.1 putative HTH transcriptional regulator [Catenibacillus scindens]